MAAAARGEHVDLDEFSDASLFFYELTGITVPGDHSTMIDWAPVKETGTALPPLRRWYQKNKDRLYWDSERQTVVVKPQ